MYGIICAKNNQMELQKMKTQMKSKMSGGIKCRFNEIHLNFNCLSSVSSDFQFSPCVNRIGKILDGHAEFDGSASKLSTILLAVNLYWNVVGFPFSLSA